MESVVQPSHGRMSGLGDSLHDIKPFRPKQLNYIVSFISIRNQLSDVRKEKKNFINDKL